MLARNRWYCRHNRPGAVPWPRRKYPAAKIEMPADAAPSKKRKSSRAHRAARASADPAARSAGRELLGRRAEAPGGHHRERHAAQCSQRKQQPTGETHAHRTQEPREPDEGPQRY